MNTRFSRFYGPEGGGGGGGAAVADAGAAGQAAGQGEGAGGRSLIDTGSGAAAGAAAGTKPAVAESWWRGWIKDTGELDPTRLSHLPEDLKGSQAILARFRKADDFFKSFAHAQQLVSQKGLTPLRPDATPEERADHMKRLAAVNGAPDKPEGYGLKHENPETQKQYDAFAKVFQKWAMPPEAVKELVALNDQLQAQQLEAYESEAARQEDAHWQEQEKLIAREFGPFKAEKTKAAIQGARWMGIDPDSAFFKQNAQLIIAAAKVGEKIGEAKFIDGGSAAADGNDPEAEMAALTNDPSHRYYDALRNPGKNPRLFQEAAEYQRKLGERIAAKRARSQSR